MLSSCSAPLHHESARISFHFHQGELESARARSQRFNDEASPSPCHQGDRGWVLPTLALIKTFQGDYQEALKDWQGAREAANKARELTKQERLEELLRRGHLVCYPPYTYEEELQELFFLITLDLAGEKEKLVGKTAQIASRFGALASSSKVSVLPSSAYNSPQNPSQSSSCVLEKLTSYLAAHLLRSELQDLEPQLHQRAYHRIRRLLLHSGGLIDPLHLEQELQVLRSAPPHMGGKKPSTGEGELLVLVYRGQMPLLRVGYSPSTLASAQEIRDYLELLGSKRGLDPLWSSIRAIPHPAWPTDVLSRGKEMQEKAQLELQIDNPLDHLFGGKQERRWSSLAAISIEEVARRELEEKIPSLIAMELARLFFKKESANELFGSFHARHTLLSDTQLLLSHHFSKPDIRHWPLLPQRLELWKVPLAQGSYTLQAKCRDEEHPTKTIEIKIQEGKTLLVHLVVPQTSSKRGWRFLPRKV